MNKIQILKAQKTKLLNKQCKNEKQFEETQDKLNEIELNIQLEKLGNKKP